MTLSVRAFARPFRSRSATVARTGAIAGLALLAFGAAVNPLLAQEFKQGDMTIDHPWSRATPAGAKVAGGYLVLHNEGTAPDRLVAVTSEIAGKAEIHEMAVDSNSVMTMRPLADGLEIPAGGEVALKPGSFHIMFMALKQPVREGEKFAATLIFEKAGSVQVEFAVGPIGGDGGQPDHTNHGG